MNKELKQKLRKLKRQELMLRYGFPFDYCNDPANTKSLEKLPLVWNDLFNLKESNRNTARYSLNQLERMDEEQLKLIFDEFWFQLYYRMYQEKGLTMIDVQQPELLNYLGLSFDADKEMVKKRFRELYKIYHPDEGGNQDKFIELMDMKDRYNKK